MEMDREGERESGGEWGEGGDRQRKGAGGEFNPV